MEKSRSHWPTSLGQCRGLEEEEEEEEGGGGGDDDDVHKFIK